MATVHSLPACSRRLLPLTALLTLNVFLLMLTPGTASAQIPSLLWSFDTGDASFGQTAAGDIDGDGRLELVFGCYRNDSSIYALNAEDGSLLWQVHTAAPGGQGCNDVAPVIIDTDGDGTMEVIVPASCNPVTYCLDGRSGEIRWTAPTRGSDSPPTVADVDADGELEILHGEFGGYVRCLNARDGSLAWHRAVDTHSWIQTAPTLLDADGDGALDFIVATWNRTEGDTNAVHAYRAADAELLWRTPLQDVTYHGTAVADFDRDGKPELAIGDYSGTLSVLNAEDGSTVWTMPSLGTGHYIGAPVIACDLDGDGDCELVLVSWNRVIALNGDGGGLWSYTIASGATAFRGAVLSDVSGDGLPDAVFGTSSGQLIALRGSDGAQLWSVDLAAAYGDTRFALDHAPVIADFDGDGGLDVFIVGGHAEYPEIANGFGRAYAYSIGTGAGPPWLMFQQNERRTSSVCAQSATSIRIQGDRQTPRLDLYPLPVSSALHIEGIDPGTVRIVDAAGRTILRHIHDSQQLTIEVSSLNPGIHFLIAEEASSCVIRSFIKK